MAMLGGRDWVLRGGHANVGGHRMTEAAAEASELASVSGARPGDAVAGDLPVWHLASLVGFA